MNQMMPSWLLPEPPSLSGVPLRPMSVGEILNGSFTLIRRSPGTILGLNLIMLTASAVVGALGGVLASRFHDGWLLLIALAADSAIITVALGAVTATAGRGILGRKVGLGEAIRLGRPGWALLAIALVDLIHGAIWTFVGLGGFGPLIILGFLASAWLGLTLSFTLPAVVLERLHPGRAIVRSWRLVLSRFWRVLGLYALVGLVAYLSYIAMIFPLEILFVIFGLPLLGSESRSLPVLLLIGAIGLVLVVIVVFSVLTALVVCAQVLIYADVRMRREGLDLVLLPIAASAALTGNEFALVSSAPPTGRAPIGGAA